MADNVRTLKLDPSRTKLLRARYGAAAVARLRLIQRDITTSIIQNDCFGLRSGTLSAFVRGNLALVVNEPAGYRQFAFTSDARKHDAFMEWLRQQIDLQVLETVDRAGNPVEPDWQDTYVRAAYQRGATQAAVEVGRAIPGTAQSLNMGAGFFFQPLHASALELLYTRNFEALKGVTDAMSQAISRELTLGFTQGLPVTQLAKRLSDNVENIGFVRARTLARTEVIHAHAQATLNVYEQMGLTEVGVEPEASFSTAHDLIVCSRCAALEGKVFTVSDARGVIPVHPNCVIPGVEVTAAGIIGASKRWYEGDVLQFTTTTGKTFTVTPNHPVLTTRGWWSAKFMDEGDILYRYVDSQDVIRNTYNAPMPQKIEEFIEAIFTDRGQEIETVPLPRESYHGEINSEQCGTLWHDPQQSAFERSKDAERALARDIKRGKYGKVTVDVIEKIKRTQYVGFVYNLETAHGFFYCDGIIVHNCRCVWKPARRKDK